MSDYTPTTERVRNSYANDIACFPKPENVFEANARAEAAKEEFDRWLASLKAEAMETGYNLGFVDGVKQSKAEAWDDATQRAVDILTRRYGASYEAVIDLLGDPNPYEVSK